MGRVQEAKHNDIVNPERKNNDIVEMSGSYLREKILCRISEYKLRTIKEFMFGGPNKFFGDCGVFINPAIKQAERFLYIWMTELDDESRKAIINYYMSGESDERDRPYKDYLCSPVWRYTASIIKFVKGCKCERCGRQYNPAHLVVHHLTYEHLGSEFHYINDDVAVLCTDCHMEIHGVRRRSK